MGIWDEIDSATIGNGRLFFLKGRYRLRIDKVAKKDAKDSFKGKNSFIVEATVLESTNPERPKGSACTWVQTVKSGDSLPDQQQRKLALGSIKEFLAAALGDPRLETASASELMTLACDASNPLSGREVALVCEDKATRDDSTFTVHRWYQAE